MDNDALYLIEERLLAAEGENQTLRMQLERLQDSEGKLHAVFDNAPSIIYLKDREGRHLLVNREFARVLQMNPEEIIGRTTAALFPPDIAGDMARNDQLVLERGKAMTFDEVIHEGHILHTYNSLKFPLCDASGAIYGLGGISTDITEWKQAEQALRQREELLDIFIEHAPAAVAMCDREMRCLAASRRWLTDYPLGALNILGLSHYEVFPEIGEEWKAIHRRCLEGASERREEDPFLRADGMLDWVRWEIVPWRQPDGSIGGILMFTEVITGRKQAEDALQRSNRALLMLSRVNEVLMHDNNETELLLDVCKVSVEIGGYRMAWVGLAEDDENKTVQPVAHAGYEAGYLNTMKFSWGENVYGRGPVGLAIRTQQPVYFYDLQTDPRFAAWLNEALKRGYESLIALPLKNETRAFGVLVLYTTARYTFTDEEVALLTQLADDLAFGILTLRLREARRQAKNALRKSERQYRTIVETAQEGIWLIDRNQHTAYANQRMADMLGIPIANILGCSLFDFIAPDQHDEMQHHVEQRRQGIQEIYEFRFRRRDGSELWALVSGSPLFEEQGQSAGTLSMLTDVTDRHHAAAYQHEFARRTLEAATEGKLLISERSSIFELAGPTLAYWEIRQADDLETIRHAVAHIIRPAGMEDERVDDLLLCISEAATNAFKHASHGSCSLHRLDDTFFVIVTDHGPGILVSNLPELAFKRGYTTAVSLGMGYKAMISLADKVYLATGPDGTVVGIQMALVTPPIHQEVFPGMSDDW